jgi:DNA-binding LytR/AlgR family response regulator
MKFRGPCAGAAVRLRGGAELPVSRDKVRRLRAALGLESPAE